MEKQRVELCAALANACVEGGVAVNLYGRSGCGKSRLLAQLDDCLRKQSSAKCAAAAMAYEAQRISYSRRFASSTDEAPANITNMLRSAAPAAAAAAAASTTSAATAAAHDNTFVLSIRQSVANCATPLALAKAIVAKAVAFVLPHVSATSSTARSLHSARSFTHLRDFPSSLRTAMAAAGALCARTCANAVPHDCRVRCALLLDNVETEANFVALQHCIDLTAMVSSDVHDTVDDDDNDGGGGGGGGAYTVRTRFSARVAVVVCTRLPLVHNTSAASESNPSALAAAHAAMEGGGVGFAGGGGGGGGDGGDDDGGARGGGGGGGGGVAIDGKRRAQSTGAPPVGGFASAAGVYGALGAVRERVRAHARISNARALDAAVAVGSASLHVLHLPSALAAAPLVHTSGGGLTAAASAATTVEAALRGALRVAPTSSRAAVRAVCDVFWPLFSKSALVWCRNEAQLSREALHLFAVVLADLRADADCGGGGGGGGGGSGKAATSQAPTLRSRVTRIVLNAIAERRRSLGSVFSASALAAREKDAATAQSAATSVLGFASPLPAFTANTSTNAMPAAAASKTHSQHHSEIAQSSTYEAFLAARSGGVNAVGGGGSGDDGDDDDDDDGGGGDAIGAQYPASLMHTVVAAYVAAFTPEEHDRQFALDYNDDGKARKIRRKQGGAARGDGAKSKLQSAPKDSIVDGAVAAAEKRATRESLVHSQAAPFTINRLLRVRNGLFPPARGHTRAPRNEVFFSEIANLLRVGLLVRTRSLSAARRGQHATALGGSAFGRIGGLTSLRLKCDAPLVYAFVEELDQLSARAALAVSGGGGGSSGASAAAAVAARKRSRDTSGGGNVTLKDWLENIGIFQSASGAASRERKRKRAQADQRKRKRV